MAKNHIADNCIKVNVHYVVAMTLHLRALFMETSIPTKVIYDLITGYFAIGDSYHGMNFTTTDLAVLGFARWVVGEHTIHYFVKS